MRSKTFITVCCREEKVHTQEPGKLMFMRNSLLDPIHGISLYDYAAVSAKLNYGAETNDACEIFGIEPAVFEEASAKWIRRMQNDKTLEITMLFGKYYTEAGYQHKLASQ